MHRDIQGGSLMFSPGIIRHAAPQVSERCLALTPTRDATGLRYPDLRIPFGVDPVAYHRRPAHVIADLGKPLPIGVVGHNVLQGYSPALYLNLSWE